MTTTAHVFVALTTQASILLVARMLRRHNFKSKYSLLWLSVGGVMLLLAVLPGPFDSLARRLGVDYQPALFLVVGLGFLLLVVVHFSYELSRMENRIRSLVEEVTFLRHDLEKSQGHPLDAHNPPPG